ncbi:MAG: bile acid:sodium symporter family protein, partial [Gammaproteobacteria bacterium]
MSRKIAGLFPLWVFALVVIAYCVPDWFIPGKPYIVPLLAVVMLTMGMTLTFRQFKEVLARPGLTMLGVGIQFVFMPSAAFVLSKLLQLPPAQTAGMILVGCSAGGTASNVICYLAGGNVALSVLMTMTSTIAAVFLMPALTYLYLNQTLPVPAFDMMQSLVEIVLLPVVAGTAINTWFGRWVEKIEALFPAFSGLSIALIIAIIVALNHANLTTLSLPLLAAVVLHNLSGLMAGYGLPRLLRFDPVVCHTLCIEVGMQNSGLSVALALQFFSTAAALPGALFSLWHNISGSLLAAYWR